MTIRKKIIPFILIACLLAAYIPSFAQEGAEDPINNPLTDILLADPIVVDNLEGFDLAQYKADNDGLDFVPNGIPGWGSNSDKPVYAKEINGNNVLAYDSSRSTNYGQFIASKGYDGMLWATVSMQLPKDYSDLRIQFKNAGSDADTTTWQLCEVHFVKSSDGYATAKINGVKDNEGSDVIKTDIPAGSIDGDGNYTAQWIKLRVLFDTISQKVQVYINNETNGKTYPFMYASLNDESASYYKSKKNNQLKGIFMSGRDGTGEFYLDNFGLYYSRDLYTDTGYIERSEIVDIYDNYNLPEVMELPIEGSLTQMFEIISWEAQGAQIDFSNKQVGTYVYHGFIDKSGRYVKYTVEIKDRYIKEIPDVYTGTYQFADYYLPTEVEVIMSDGNKKMVPVTWDENSVDTSQTGVVHITGSVDPTPNADVTTDVIIHVGITVYEVKKIKDVYVGVPVGTQGYTLPDRVEAEVADGSKKEVAVVWDGTVPDTSEAGVYTYKGRVSGWHKEITMQLTVYEEDPDDENLYEALVEYYGHILNEGRDRTRYGFSESDPNPIFAAGINRLTGEHSMWSFEHEGDTPLTDLASMTCTVKGLVAMSEIMQGEDALLAKAKEQYSKIDSADYYEQAVYDAYRYYLENFWDDGCFMPYWGGHAAVNMETYEADLRLDTHELKDHYPMFDIMYEIDPEKTARYIKALWIGHVKDTSNLQFSRHYTFSNALDVDAVDAIFDTIDESFDKNKKPFFYSKEGLLTFITAANDFIFAAGELYGLNGDENALNAAVNMQSMFLKGRHTGHIPEVGDHVPGYVEEKVKEGTGLIPFLFTESKAFREPVYDVWAPYYDEGGFGTDEFKNRMQFNLFDLTYADPDYPEGNPYVSDFGMNYDRSIDITIYCYNPMVMFRMAQSSDEETRDYLIKEAVETLAAFIKHKYVPGTNQGKPTLIDGTDLTGYLRKRTGYTGDYGVTFEPWILEADYILGFIRGYLNAMNYPDEQMQEYAQTIWGAVRNMFQYYGAGDVGTAPGENMELNLNTDCEQPFVLISLCELYNKFSAPEYLELARVVANNILKNRFADGYFYEKPNMLHANFNTEEPYAIIYFLATVKGIAQNIPEHFGSRGFFQFDWYEQHTGQNKKLYSNKLWSLTTTGEVLASAIELDVNTLELSSGDKYTLSATIEPEDTEDKTIEYVSSDENVCIVNEDGVITAVSAGEATVTATAVSGGCDAKVVVKVK